MKKRIALCLALALALLLPACGSAQSDSPDAEPTPAADTGTAPTPEQSTPTPDKDTSTAVYFSYEDLLMDIAAENEYATYSVYDLDGNGTNELIVKLGEHEEEYMYHFYTLGAENEVLEFGQFSGWCSALYADGDTPGILHVSTSQNTRTATRLAVENGALVSSPIYSGDTAAALSNAAPLAVRYVTDASLLAPDAELTEQTLPGYIDVTPIPDIPVPTEPTPDLNIQTS